MNTVRPEIPPASASGWYGLREFVTRNRAAHSENSVRYFVQHAARFGLEPAIARAGAKILIHESTWFECFRRRPGGRK